MEIQVSRASFREVRRHGKVLPSLHSYIQTLCLSKRYCFISALNHWSWWRNWKQNTATCGSQQKEWNWHSILSENPDFQNVQNKTWTSFPAFGNCFKIKSEKISLNFLVCSSVPLYISVLVTLLQSLNIRYCFMINTAWRTCLG